MLKQIHHLANAQDWLFLFFKQKRVSKIRACSMGRTQQCYTCRCEGGGAFVRGRVLEELTFPFSWRGSLQSLCDACH